MMRTQPIIGKKAWFGPRRFGWGWTPMSWEGWVVTAVVLAALLLPFALTERVGSWAVVAWSTGVALLAIILCAMKGTSPGGPAKRRELLRERRGSE